MLRLAWIAGKTLTRRVWRLPREAAVALGAPLGGQKARPERLWQACAIVLPVAMLTALAMPRIVWVMSPSIEAWGLRPAPGPIAKGDFVMFTLSHPLAGPEPVNVTKYALCMPGESLTMIEKPSPHAPAARDGYYYCDGVLLGVSKPFGRNGQRLEHLRWQGRLPVGQVYVGSHHPSGFDSRYFGPVPLERLTRMERVL